MDPLKAKQALEALDGVKAQLADALDETPPVTSTDAPYYDPTSEQKAAFATKHGIAAKDIDGWDGVEPNTAQKKIAALPEGATLAEKLEYAGFGYVGDGTRRNWRADKIAASRAACRFLTSVEDPAAAERLYPGCSNVGSKALKVLVSIDAAIPQAFYGPLSQDPTEENAFAYGSGTLKPFVSGS